MNDICTKLKCVRNTGNNLWEKQYQKNRLVRFLWRNQGALCENKKKREFREVFPPSKSK